MPKPRRTTTDAFYDVFADFPVPDQIAALRILTEIHRQALRAQRSKPAPAPPPPPTLPLVPPSAVNAADPAHNAALLLPGEDELEGPKQ